MKKISKESKVGFTLLEVILAVAILMICSMMLIRGFLSTLQYSNNTSVYLKVSGLSYSTGIKNVASDSNRQIYRRSTQKLNISSSITVTGLPNQIGIDVQRSTGTGTGNINSLTSRFSDSSSNSYRRTSILLGNLHSCGSKVYAYDDDNDGDVDGYFCQGCGAEFSSVAGFI